MFPQLRAFKESDLAHLVNMEAEYYREVDPTEEFSESKFYSEVSNALNSPRQKIFIAQVQGEIAGFIWLEEYDEEGGRLGYISNIHVAKHHRGKGLAKYLLKRAEDYFREKGIGRLQLEVVEGNKTAMNLYIRNGFKLTTYHQSKNEFTPAGDYLEKSLT
jgi:ribosomal protein S18 acetylase RimI-like enzyme